MRKRILSILLVMISIIAMALSGCGSKKEDKEEKTATAEDTLDEFVNTVFNEGILEEKLEVLKEMTPDNVGEFITEEWLQQNVERVVNRRIPTYKKQYGEDYRATYEILEEKEVKGSELQELENALKKQYEGVEFKFEGKAYYYTVEITRSGSEKSESFTWEDFAVIKIDGKWYPCFTHVDEGVIFVGASTM